MIVEFIRSRLRHALLGGGIVGKSAKIDFINSSIIRFHLFRKSVVFSENFTREENVKVTGKYVIKYKFAWTNNIENELAEKQENMNGKRKASGKLVE